ncbi:MAG: beta-galactosidase [Bacteroidales bacterium]|nr:beta-galactosidase [Bacteroidales bacterium]
MNSCAEKEVEYDWQPAGDKIMTDWGENLTVADVYGEYPRPQMVREKWTSLNGLWNYKTDKSEGMILVPFAIESALSGVGEFLNPDEKLIYTREFKLSGKDFKGRVLLHAGAIDQDAVVFINDKEVAHHIGGYASFSADITDVAKKGSNTIRIEVIDNTNDGYMATGKQVRNPRGIWYTPVSGIWQTIWLEPVPANYIKDLMIIPDIDASKLAVTVIPNTPEGEVYVEMLADGNVVASATAAATNPVVSLAVENQHLWSPDDPYLYDLKVELRKNGKTIDKVDSYAAMRKISTAVDRQGIKRAQLNNKDIFMMGPLDQGWWPDGLYTAPTDEALLFDIQRTKDLGFNTIRKHVKVEPDRWYYYCDKLGMLVWQDMPSGDRRGTDWSGQWKFLETDPQVRTEESMKNYYHEWGEIMAQLKNHPSIVVWVPYNEAWGQSRSVEVANWTKAQDPSRLVNTASGGNHFRVGDIIDQHHYPEPKMTFFEPGFVNVLGEYGGIGYPISGHLWDEGSNRNWGYVSFDQSEVVTNNYVDFANMMLDLVPKGFSAAIYTQTTDVESEVNGLFTYDRKVLKMDEDKVRDANQELCHSLD